MSAIVVLPRSGWATDSYPIGTRLQTRGIVLHHTATPNVSPLTGEAEQARAYELVRGIWRYHVQNNGWKDIGYHFVVARSGLIIEARRGSSLVLKDGRLVTGSHCPTKNTTHVGICLEGNYQIAQDVPSVLWESLVRLIAYLSYVAGFSLDRSAVLLHREVRQTLCPGDLIAQKVDAIVDHAARVKQRLLGGG